MLILDIKDIKHISSVSSNYDLINLERNVFSMNMSPLVVDNIASVVTDQCPKKNVVHKQLQSKP